MWIYIVSWILLTVSVSSPKPEVDEYGRRSNFTYAVACLTLDSNHHSKTFTNRDFAFAFYQKTLRAGRPVELLIPERSDIDSVKIDSTWLSKENKISIYIKVKT